MYKKSVFIKDGFLTFSAISLFSVLFFVAHATTSEVIPLPVVFETQSATVALSEAIQQTNNESSTIDIQFEQLIHEVAQEPLVVKTEKDEVVEEPLIDTVVTTPKPAVVQKETQAVHNVQTVQVVEQSVSFETELTQLIAAQTNEFRKDYDLHILAYDNTLEKNAHKYSLSMLATNFFSHVTKQGCDFSCRFEKDGYEAQTWGENLAMYSFSEKHSVEEVAFYFMSQWKKSAGHRDNLLSEAFTEQGIGVSMDNNTIYISVQFAKPE